MVVAVVEYDQHRYTARVSATSTSIIFVSRGGGPGSVCEAVVAGNRDAGGSGYIHWDRTCCAMTYNENS